MKKLHDHAGSNDGDLKFNQLQGRVEIFDIEYRVIKPQISIAFSNPRRVPCEISQIDVSFSYVCPVIDHEFRHNIVKEVVDP